MDETKKVVEVVGIPIKSYGFGNGIVFYYREMTTEETTRFKNSITFRRRGKSFQTNSAKQQIELADAILEDVEGLGYPDKEDPKKNHWLDKSTKPADIAHLKVEGVSPKDFKALIPARYKCMFIDAIFVGQDLEEKN